MVSSHWIPTIAILCIFIGTIQQVCHVGENKESNKKLRGNWGVQSKKWCPSHKFFFVLFSVTQSFLLGFSWSSDNITVSKKKNTFKEGFWLSCESILFSMSNELRFVKWVRFFEPNCIVKRLIFSASICWLWDFLLENLKLTKL